MLVTLNAIDPDYLQAYRLYKLSTEIDEDKLCKTVQILVERLSGAHTLIIDSIQIEMKKRLNETTKLPEYSVDIPVTFDFSDKQLKKTKSKRFGLASKSINAELQNWYEMRLASEDEVKAAFRLTDRALERSSEQLHSEPEYPEFAIRKLDKYEVLDFEYALENTYDEIEEALSELPREPLYKESDVGDAATKVKESILGRMTRTQAFAGTGLIAGLFCLSFIPAVVFLNTQTNGSVWTIVGAIAIGVGLLALVTVILLQVRRMKLTKTIDTYTGTLKRTLTKLLVSAKDFSLYMSKIGSHIKGSSYLKLFRKKNYNEEQLMQVRKAHSRAIEALIEKLRIWSVAFHIPVNFAEDAIDNNVMFDPYCPPGSNMLYTFETGARYQVPLNVSGYHVDSPFEFVTQLKINREELYNDE